MATPLLPTTWRKIQFVIFVLGTVGGVTKAVETGEYLETYGTILCFWAYFIIVVMIDYQKRAREETLERVMSEYHEQKAEREAKEFSELVEKHGEAKAQWYWERRPGQPEIIPPPQTTWQKFRSRFSRQP